LEEPLDHYREREQRARGQEKAFLHLLISGAEGALGFLEAGYLDDFDLMDTIEQYYKVVEEYYRNRLNLPWTYSPPVVVDRYPEPAQDEDWFAVSSVPGGPRPGYPAGIYFLRRHMMPDVAALATLHENVHLFGIGASQRGGYYRYFDEGCANFLAYLTYYHKNRDLGPIQRYRTFLQEINNDLYEYPSFDRIMASLVHQVGVTGLYRLILRRLNDVNSVDWKEVLRATASGQMKIEPREGEPADADLPPLVHELQEGAEKMISLITYPERLLMSPIAYLAYDQMCREGEVRVDEIQARWQLTSSETADVVKELAGVYLWKETDGVLRSTMFRSDLFHDTGVVRASAIDIPAAHELH
jgi:hypothetical protein